MILSFLMVVIAGILWLRNEIENSKLEEKSYDVVENMEEIFDEYIAKKDDENLQRVNKLEVDGITYMGVLTIPSLNNMSLGVIQDFSMDNLKVSVCKYAGSPEKKLIIAGHNYKYSFGQLSKLNVGSIAYFKTMDGITYKYKCSEILVLGPDDTEKMKEGDWNLTLFTCTFGGKNRLTVRFQLESVVSI